ncbi:fetuin-B-like [Protobothrops mucrosquamatus]|uniref:fetuin-B-like n=1 Tax=Protobothrops mucrosquamatus TaxID=103944 RepID=UPI0010FB8B12|nr:fetuin-B-like [Protobothrops mucrosquamatus]
MRRLISFFIGIQMLLSMVASSPLPFVHPSCSSLEVKAAAEAAVDKLNAHRKEGYILGLQRIFDARELPQFGSSLFYLTLDMLETDCYVLTRKPWKECKIRHLYETVYGQCKVVIVYNKNTDYSHLFSYHCALRPVSSSDIVFLCPDCPTPGNTSEAVFQQTALESLAKFNAENEHNRYFGLDKVTKASSQWVVGPSNFVEYTIRETSCPKSTSVSDVTQCPFLPVETAKRGLCKGSVIISEIEKKKFVTVKCDFFPPPIVHTLAASTAPSFVYPSCNSVVVKAAAEVALNKVNSNRKQGYVLGLQRIFDVHELPKKNGDSLFYLILDVLETKCHIQSGKKWKECEFRNKEGALFHAVASVPLPHFLSPSCNSVGVNIAAEEALNKHNKYRTEGYVLGLQRIFDAQEVSEKPIAMSGAGNRGKSATLDVHMRQ